MANSGLPETSEELIAQGRLLTISKSGESCSLKLCVDPLRQGQWSRVAGLAGHSEFVVN
jgi:hypothetical protein